MNIHATLLLMVLGAYTTAPVLGATLKVHSNHSDKSAASTKVLMLQDLQRITPVTKLKVFEPHEQKEVTYKGFAANPLLDKFFGKDWQKSDEVLFTCADGYQASVPVSYFQKHRGFLVYERPGSEFKVTNTLQGNEVVPLGPFYLVWDNLKTPELRNSHGTHWPYQVTEVSLIEFSETFAQMIPPKPSKNVKSGFALFKTHCMTCHTINGDGGDKSVELNYPVSVTEYMKPEWLVKWIDDPPAIRYNSRMPRLNPNMPHRQEAIKDIVAYLKAMASHKQQPKP